MGIAIHSSSQTQAVSGQQETIREGNWDWAGSCMAVTCLRDESRLSLVTLCFPHMSHNLRHVSVNFNNIEGNIRQAVQGAVHVQAPRLCTLQLVQSTLWQCQQLGSSLLGAMAHVAVWVSVHKRCAELSRFILLTFIRSNPEPQPA